MSLEERAGAPDISPQPLNILILEDRQDDAELVVHALQRSGLDVTWQWAATREAYMAQLHPDLDVILADYSLPQFNVLEALDILRERDLQIPLIIVSGTIGEEAAVEGLKHGAVDYLLKDRMGRLEGAIRNALREKALRRQRQEAIDALRQSESRYRKLVEESLQGIVIIQDMRTVYCNQAYADIVGYTMKEVSAMTPQETAALVHPGDLPLLLAYYRKRLAGETVPARYEFRILRRDGAVRWLDGFISTTTFKGAPAIQAYYVDVTERKQAEEAAREQEARRRVEQILDAVGEAVIVLNRRGRVQQVNPAFTEQTGYSAGEIRGAYYRTLWSEDTGGDESFLQEVREALAQNRSWRGQTRIRRRNGAYYDAAMTITPMNGGSGENSDLVVSIRDISHMKEVERLKDSIISIAAHELRTPLTTIGLYSEVLATREMDEQRRKRYMTAVYEQSQQLKKIIDDMLDLARLEAGRGLETAAEPVDIGALAVKEVTPFAEMSSRHRFTLHGLLDTSLVKGDPVRLSQVMRNLLSNAVKYSPEGGQIKVSGRNGNGFVQVSIEDQGIGIAPEQQARLFEKFYRADSSQSAPRGTGLGLAISRLIVEGHGGRIWAQSEPGMGSTFIFTIPVAGAMRQRD